MLRLDGYQIWEQIHDTRTSEVYTATRIRDSARVILKRYRREQDKQGSRAREEFELLQRIESDSVVRALELCDTETGPVLIVERFPGYPLSHYAKQQRLPTGDLLAIALGIVHGLAAIHDARIIHRDIKLSNIMIDPETSRVCLIDFGISTEFGRTENPAPPDTAEGTMQYIAPEQTGRMGLGVDFRSDLYSFGAALYELLTGTPPFTGQRGADLVLAHLTQRPTPPVELDSGISGTLSRIAIKLLEKDPELRYQTARGLAEDLAQCEKDLHDRGEINEEMVLGLEDASDRLRFTNKLYGRDAEKRQLRTAWERVQQGSVEFILLAGPAGIGKSSLPSTLRRPVARAGGYLAEAKLDPELRGRPYECIAAAFRGLADQLLAASHAQVESWRGKLREELGALGSALVQLVPELQHLIEEKADLQPVRGPEGGPEDRERMSLAVVRFVRCLASRAHPLILFFDDLQWADAGSLSLIDAILRSRPVESLMLIGSYRDNEVAGSHPLLDALGAMEQSGIEPERITLGPLGAEHTSAMLAEVLGRQPEETTWLAHRVGLKTQHNPLLVKRLLFHLWDRDLIYYRYGEGWSWDPSRLSEADITDDAAEMVAARIDSLSTEILHLIKAAALMGTSFHVETLVPLVGLDRLDVLQQLMVLVDQGVVTPCRQGFKFVHDRLREAVLSRWDVSERAQFHHRAARLLLDTTSDAEREKVIFQLADHLIASRAHWEERDRTEVLDVLHRAGGAALEKGAPESAAYYLEAASTSIVDADWTQRFDLLFEIQLRESGALTQLRQFERALKLLEGLERHSLTELQRGRLLARRLSTLAMTDRPVLLQATLEALRSFGIRWPAEPSLLRTWIEILRTEWMLRGPIDEQMFPGKPTADLSWLSPILIIRAGAFSISSQSYCLNALVFAFVLRTYHRRGVLRCPAASLSHYAGARVGVTRSLRGIAHYARAAEYWLARMPESSEHIARFSVSIFAYSWLRSRMHVVAALRTVEQDAVQAGDIEFAYYAAHQSATFAALSGDPIPGVLRSFSEIQARHLSWSSYIGEISAESYQLLHDSRRSFPLLQDERSRIVGLIEPESPAALHCAIHLIVMLVFVGEFELVDTIFAKLWRRVLTTGMLGSRFADYTLYYGLSNAVLLQRERFPRLQHRRARTLRRCLRWMRRWAAHGPDFAHMTELLMAERCVVRGRTKAALEHYERSAERARAVGYVHHAALAQERRSKLAEATGRRYVAILARSEAKELYAEWGAYAKVAQLERQSAYVE